MASKKDLIRLQAERDLESFIRLVQPQRLLGSVHCELISWWNREDAKSHQLVLLPRDHQKSAMIALRCAHEIVKNPAIRILYISSTANLATKQLKFIKDILESDVVRFYWPDLIHPDEGKREKWTESEISVDHPKRKAEAVRDPTVFTAGLTTNIAGMHCDIAVMDDVVVIDNAYTEESRTKVKQQYSLLSSIEGVNAREWIVGTRYHPKDLYNDLMGMMVPTYGPDGEIVSEDNLYEKFERQVENRGDGTGEFLWPRQMRSDGQWFGFDQDALAKKRAQYLDKVQFQAQYYNNPNDPEGAGIMREAIQYYDKSFLSKIAGRWYFKGQKLNVFAALDIAYSLGKKSDYTCIVVVGVDSRNNYYVLDIDRFKTELISEYYKRVLQLYSKWEFRKLIAECTAAQAVIVKDLKENYLKPNGVNLAVEDFKPNRQMGSKEERISAILQPRFSNRQVWLYQGGNCQILEEELMLSNPPHDDIKDALATCIDGCIAPTFQRKPSTLQNNPMFHSRFGGIS